MVSLVARRALISRAGSSRMMHSWTGAVSTSTMQLKPGGHHGYFDTLHETMPEISKLTDGAWASTKGVVSVASFSSAPRAGSTYGMNLWKDMATLEKVLPMAGPIYEKLGQHLDTSVERIASFNECDVMDYGVLTPSEKYQPAVLTLSEFQTKPGAAKEILRKLLGDPEIEKQMKELNLGIAFQIVTYPSETSMFSHAIFKDFDDYVKFRSDANQQKLAAWYKDSGFLDILTGPVVGRTVFPEAFVLVK